MNRGTRPTRAFRKMAWNKRYNESAYFLHKNSCPAHVFLQAFPFQTQVVLLPSMAARLQRSDSPKPGANLISNRPKYLLAGAGVAVLIYPSSARDTHAHILV